MYYNMLKNVHFKYQTKGHITQSSLQNLNITYLEKFVTINNLKEQYMKRERSQSSSGSLKPQYDKSVSMVKIPLEIDYAYDYKKNW